MPEGTIEFFHDRKGYGFISTEARDDDVFFHMEDIGGPDVEEGDEVEFEIEEGAEGPRVSRIQHADTTSSPPDTEIYQQKDTEAEASSDSDTKVYSADQKETPKSGQETSSSSDISYCPSCGENLSGSPSFCQSCGQDLSVY
jgi:CspA family cold shock protein